MAKTRGGIRNIRPANTGLFKSSVTTDDISTLQDSYLNAWIVTDLNFDQRGRARALNMSQEAAMLISSYTYNAFQPINRALLNKEEQPDKATLLFSEKLTSALEIVPKYDGFVYHGQSSSRASQTIAKLKEMGTFQYDGFLSASKNFKKTVHFAEGGTGTFFRIKSKQGRDLGVLSGQPEEREVLFKPKTKFKFIRERNIRGTRIIEIEEI